MITYFISFLIVQTILLIWFESPMKLSLGKFMFNKTFFDGKEFDIHIMFLNSTLGKLISCEICLSVWISLIVSIISGVFTSTPILFPIICTGTFPILSYVFRKKLIHH